MTDIFWRKDACALNCMFLRQGYKDTFVCTKYGGTLMTGKDGAPTASPKCEITKKRKEEKHEPQQKD